MPNTSAVGRELSKEEEKFLLKKRTHRNAQGGDANVTAKLRAML